MSGRRQFGTVRKLPSGHWQARYRDPQGERHTGPQTFTTRGDATRWLALAEADMHRGVWQNPELAKVLFQDWARKWLAASAHRRPTTVARDRVVIDTHLLPALGPRKLGDLTALDVQAVVNTMAERLAPATVRTNYGVLRAVLNAAVDADLLVRSPCRGIKLPATARHREIRFLTAGELRRLADGTPMKYRPVIYLAGVLGLRWSEIAGLRTGRVDLARRTIEVSETMSEVDGRLIAADVKSRSAHRILEMPKFLAKELAPHVSLKKPDELVFTAPEGGPLRAGNFRNRVWAPAVRDAGLGGQGLTFHHLRHTAVGLLIDANAPQAVMQRRMGHSSIRTTLDVYGHVLPATDTRTTEHLENLFTDRPPAPRRGARLGHDAGSSQPELPLPGF